MFERGKSTFGVDFSSPLSHDFGLERFFEDFQIIGMRFGNVSSKERVSLIIFFFFEDFKIIRSTS